MKPKTMTHRTRIALTDYLEDVRQRNEVNYDALLEAGSIVFKDVVSLVYKSRRATLGKSRRLTFGPEGHRHQPPTSRRTIEARKNKKIGWWPSKREDAGDLIGKAVSPTYSSQWSYHQAALTKSHVTLLVKRGLQGCDVPLDVQEAIDCCGCDKKGLLMDAVSQFAAAGRRCTVQRCGRFTLAGLLVCPYHAEPGTLEQYQASIEKLDAFAKELSEI